jgi:hypothetical protein
MFSFYAILWEVYSYKQYNKSKDILTLMIFALIEPFVFHPIVSFSALRGNYKKLFGLEGGWGAITRKGFTKV